MGTDPHLAPSLTGEVNLSMINNISFTSNTLTSETQISKTSSSYIQGMSKVARRRMRNRERLNSSMINNNGSLTSGKRKELSGVSTPTYNSDTRFQNFQIIPDQTKIFRLYPTFFINIPTYSNHN